MQKQEVNFSEYFPIFSNKKNDTMLFMYASMVATGILFKFWADCRFLVGAVSLCLIFVYFTKINK